LRVLIDTNVFIHGESNKIIESEVAEFISLAIKHHITILVHPASLEDLGRDPDISRKNIHRSKFEKYPVLENNAKPDKYFNEALGEISRPQDEVDNKILYSIYKSAASFLITGDFGIHRKAGKLGIEDRVLTVSQALLFLKKQFERYVPGHILLENIPIHILDLKSCFFDSLRENYPEFDEWFINKGKEGRMCWCWREKDKELKALLIYTEKDKQMFRENKEKTLKICTFKVSEDARGLKVGELLLKMAFEYCIKNNLTTTYLTTYPKKEYLRILLEDFGFKKIDETSQGELIYAKDFTVPASIGEMNPLDYCKEFFPSFYDGNRVNKFMVPIRPEYHDRLFKDYKDKCRRYPIILSFKERTRYHWISSS
jgi:predicted nucleic acid-binding protein/ribosomal protein S18 acetylase RimI-like enzyme